MGIIYKNGIPYGNQPSIDATLTHQGEAADAKAVGDEISGVKNTLNHKADIIYDTASGDIASFPDGADGLPVKDLTVAIEPVQSGTGDPSPTNVRPISGWTGANVTRTGKNLLNYDYYYSSFKIAENTFVGNSSTIANNVLIHIPKSLVGKQLTFSAYIDLSGLSTPTTYYALANVSGSTIQGNSIAADSKGFSSVTFTPTSTSDLIGFSWGSGSGTITLSDLQLEIGSSRTVWVSYLGTTIPISWQSEAGTVYGGTLDVTSGLLTVTMGYVDLGTLYWGTSSISSVFYTVDVTSHTLTKPVCSVYKGYDAVNGSQAAYDNGNGTCCFYNTSDKRLFVRDDRYSDASTFKSAMSGVQLVYELATPLVYNLDPATVSTLLGQNNIWSDTGSSTVEYPADTKLYIQKINTPTDDDMIADANVASGQYFIVNNNLYLSTAAILAGDPIKPGTNCTLTNLAAALNALNS